MKIYVDIDETIAYYPKGIERKYENAQPLEENIKKVNKLYDNGNEIHIWTGRGTETKINYRELTERQLKLWKVKYNYLEFGKPNYDILYDDKAHNSITDW